MAKDKVTFTGVKLHSFARDRKGGKAKLSSLLSAPIQKLMKWADMPEDYPSAAPGGVIVASHMLLKSNAGDLATFDVGVDIASLGDFEIVRLEVQGKRGKGKRLELHFTAKFTDVAGCGVLETYLCTAADSVGTLEVTYQAASGKVDVTNAQQLDADRQASLEMGSGDDSDDDAEAEDE